MALEIGFTFLIIYLNSVQKCPNSRVIMLISRSRLLSMNNQLTPVSSAGRRTSGNCVRLSATCAIAFKETYVDLWSCGGPYRSSSSRLRLERFSIPLLRPAFLKYCWWKKKQANKKKKINSPSCSKFSTTPHFWLASAANCFTFKCCHKKKKKTELTVSLLSILSRFGSSSLFFFQAEWGGGDVLLHLFGPLAAQICLHICSMSVCLVPY